MALTWPVTPRLIIEHCPFCASFAARARSVAEADAALGAHVLHAHRVRLALKLVCSDPTGLRADDAGLVRLPAIWRVRSHWQ